jgi:CBS-domain-containing membrane protein
MPTSSKSLIDLTAADLMSRDIIALPASLSLRAAAHELIRAGISGAPVVDESGRCLGVLSQTDLVRFLDKAGSATLTPAGVFADWQMVGLDDLPGDEVTSYMTPGAITASPQTPVAELAGLMADSHIHRVLIADVSGKVVGIVSSLDILKALADQANPPS